VNGSCDGLKFKNGRAGFRGVRRYTALMEIMSSLILKRAWLRANLKKSD
jgi:hypothetical protein